MNWWPISPALSKAQKRLDMVPVAPPIPGAPISAQSGSEDSKPPYATGDLVKETSQIMTEIAVTTTLARLNCGYVTWPLAADVDVDA